MGADPAEEEQFGPYLVYERLGVGGMATVHRALERGADGAERMVALKRLLPHLAEDASFVKSFVREAKLASILNHVNIVQTYELGRVGSEYFISMEYIDGRDLRRLLRHARKVTGPPPIHITVGLMIQLADALDYAHHKVDEEGHPLGLVHRDVSPSNLLVTNAGHLKVIDFGIAKAQSSQLRTQTGRVKGKLAYMAPEAITARELDARSDIWAAGVIAHELLTARPLFASKNEYQTLIKVQRGDILPPSTFNQACPPELDAIVFKALARDPDERYRSAGDLREDLHGIRALYELQTGYRDIAEWIEWAFSLEMPASFSGKDTTGVSGVAPIPVTPKPRLRTPRPRNKDEEEAVEMAWGTGEAEADAGGVDELLDEVPDVSGKHLASTRSELEHDDIPAPTPSHGPSDKVEVSLGPEPSAAVAAALAAGTNPPVARGSGPVRVARRSSQERAATVRQSSQMPAVKAEDAGPRRPSDRVPVQRKSDRVATVAETPKRTTAPGIAIPRRAPSALEPSPFDVKTRADTVGEAPTSAIDMPSIALEDLAGDEPIEIIDPGPPRGRPSDPPPVAGPSLLDASELFGPDLEVEAGATTPRLPVSRPATPSTPPPTARPSRPSMPATPSTPSRPSTPELVPPPEPPPDLPPVPVVRFSKSQVAVDADGQPRRTGQRAAASPTTGQRAVAVPRDDASGVTTPQLAPPRAKRTSTPAATASVLPEAPRPPPPRRGFVIIGGVALSIGAAGIAYRLMTHRASPEQHPYVPPAPGVVSFAITPADADVVVDHGASHHGTPWQESLAPGVHQIEIHHDGYKPFMTRIELSPHETHTLQLSLDKLAPAAPAATATATASLSLDTTPPGMTAVLDGKPLPNPTPIRLDIPVGPHTIAVLQNGADAWHETFNADANSEIAFAPEFTAAKKLERAERAARTPRASSASPDDGAGGDHGGGSAATPAPTPPVAAPAPIVVHATDVVKVSGAVPALGAAAPSSIEAKLCIDPTGSVTSAQVLGIDAQDTQKLAAALRTWRYAPYRRAGVALPACFTISVHP